ncbi:uncharacterized protein PHALS_06225 [Plasmopara halstedii]|uniref:Uncharacterized protein n=1 Tax=Plasmopara halstedii TaxID=4781 RepID=A0A0P1B144_PLAHL|nr:uncharacterized protein PHALS_06225 [Plasmopara halstedii]CEG48400.1 hypothetical protein PHALS_06225 [Plasmopara halstedii]|eukprot:XP_024584769.1 hypothetical protein PHALS_06225 [Plasmopara halstedii]
MRSVDYVKSEPKGRKEQGHIATSKVRVLMKIIHRRYVALPMFVSDLQEKP